MNQCKNVWWIGNTTLGCYKTNDVCTSSSTAFCENLNGAANSVDRCRTRCSNSTSDVYAAGNCASSGGCAVVLVSYETGGSNHLCCECISTVDALNEYSQTTGCTGLCTDDNICGKSGAPPSSCNGWIMSAYLINTSVFLYCIGFFRYPLSTSRFRNVVSSALMLCLFTCSVLNFVEWEEETVRMKWTVVLLCSLIWYDLWMSYEIEFLRRFLCRSTRLTKTDSDY